MVQQHAISPEPMQMHPARKHDDRQTGGKGAILRQRIDQFLFTKDPAIGDLTPAAPNRSPRDRCRARIKLVAVFADDLRARVGIEQIAPDTPRIAAGVKLNLAERLFGQPVISANIGADEFTNWGGMRAFPNLAVQIHQSRAAGQNKIAPCHRVLLPVRHDLLIEAMKTFNQIKAPRAGMVASILVQTGAPVEYGEVLIILE